MIIAAVIAIIMSSVLLADRNNDAFTETQMRAQFATMFLSFIIMGIMSIFSVLPVMMSIRDMFYRHRAAGMIGSGSLAWALGYAEKGFILVTSTIFCVLFLLIGFSPDARYIMGSLAFWVSIAQCVLVDRSFEACIKLIYAALSFLRQGFFTFNIAIYSYFGQAFVCFFRPMATAQILASVFIGLNNFFSGLIVRPQFMKGLFAFTYWITPGHYVYEGMITSTYDGDDRAVVADFGSDFYYEIGCDTRNFTGDCTGRVDQYMDSFFGGKFQKDHIAFDFIILGVYLVVARFVTFLALNYINFSAT